MLRGELKYNLPGFQCTAGYNFKALSCTPTYLNTLISQFLHINLRNLLLLDSNLLGIIGSLLISMCG